MQKRKEPCLHGSEAAFKFRSWVIGRENNPLLDERGRLDGRSVLILTEIGCLSADRESTVDPRGRSRAGWTAGSANPTFESMGISTWTITRSLQQ